MNTTYILNKEELSEKLQKLLRWFDIEVIEEGSGGSVCWSVSVKFRGRFVGFLNCIHLTGMQDTWTVTRWDDRIDTISSHTTLDFDEAVEFLMHS